MARKYFSSSFRLSLYQVGLVANIGLSFLGVKSNEGVTGERRTKVRDDRGGDLVNTST